MNELVDALGTAAMMIAGFDTELIEIVGLSLRVSLTAVGLATLIGLPLGAAIALFRFAGRGALVVVLNALMGLPPVVVGLVVYLMLSRSGPFGVFGLLFSPTAMIIAQCVLVTPIIAALTRQVVEDLWQEYAEQLRSLGSGPGRAIRTLLWDGRFSLVTAGARRLRPRQRRGRRRDDRRRQHRPRDARHDHRDRARGLEGRPGAGARPRHRADRDNHAGQRRRRPDQAYLRAAHCAAGGHWRVSR